MPSRAAKEERMSDNYKKAIRRAINQWEQMHRTRCPENIKQQFKKEFKRALKLADNQLAEVWNQ